MSIYSHEPLTYHNNNNSTIDNACINVLAFKLQSKKQLYVYSIIYLNENYAKNKLNSDTSHSSYTLHTHSARI